MGSFMKYMCSAVLVGMVVCSAGCLDGARFGQRARYRFSEKPTGAVAGYVTDGASGGRVADVAISFEPVLEEGALRTDLHPVRAGAVFSTDDKGFYYANIPVGSYKVGFSKEDYQEAEKVVEVEKGAKVAGDVVLEPGAPVVVYAGETVTGAAPGGTVQVKAKLAVRDGSKVQKMGWEVQPEAGRVTPRKVTVSQAEATVVLPDITAYKGALLERLGRQGRLLDRWMVLGLGPVDLKEAGKVVMVASADTTSGTYSDSVAILTDLSSIAAVNPGLRNVPVGNAVLLQGKEQPRYAWSLGAPADSTAVLHDAATRNPSFTPDRPGVYSVEEGGVPRLAIYAGTWNGALVARETDRRPPWIGREGCLCHYDDAVSAKFDKWRGSGHAQIFTYNVEHSYRYQTACFACHAVGFARGVPVDHFLDRFSYDAFLNDSALWDLTRQPPLLKPDPRNLDYLLDKHPKVVRFANVQCENCHGPNNSEAHKTWRVPGPARRISYSATVCATCHDQFSDNSYEQWRESGHGNYNLAIEVATVEKRGAETKRCGHCHSAQGFLAWRAQRQRTLPIQGKSGDATPEELAVRGLSVDAVHPVTCAVCHDPHAAGNSFRYATEKVPSRISDAELHPAEFRGVTGGRGALCVTCHSTDTGPHSDSTAPPDLSKAPHAAQGDVLMGQNAFFVEPGRYASHARIEDTCVWCHAKPVPKDPPYGYGRGGVNHTFEAAGEVCARCHLEIEGEALLKSGAQDLEKLKSAVEGALLQELRSGGEITLCKAGRNGVDAVFDPRDASAVELLELKGEMAMALTTRFGLFRAPLGRVLVRDAPLGMTARGKTVLKAAWNYLLLKSDASNGAHNPQFVSEVLGNTMEKLAASRH